MIPKKNLAPPLLPSFPDTSAPWCQHLRPWQQWFDAFFSHQNLWIMGPRLFKGFVGDYTAQLQGAYNKPLSLRIRFCWAHTCWIFDLGKYFRDTGGGKGGGAEHEQRLIVCTFCLKLALRHPLIYLCDAWAKPIWNKICSGKQDDLCQHKEQKIQNKLTVDKKGTHFIYLANIVLWQNIPSNKMCLNSFCHHPFPAVFF